jgi:hypothetical protein
MRRLRAILGQRCPRCLDGRIWRAFLSMNVACPVCGLVFEREPGYFTGAMVVSYVLAIPVLGAIVIGLMTLGGLDAVPALVIGDVAYLALVPFIFRYSRVLWLHFDWSVDPDRGGDTRG